MIEGLLHFMFSAPCFPVQTFQYTQTDSNTHARARRFVLKSGKNITHNVSE